MKTMILIPPFPQVSWLMQPPIAALYTASILREKKINFSLYDIRFNDNDEWKKDIANCSLVIIETAEYDFTQCYPFDLSKIKRIIEDIRMINNTIRIVCAGPHGSIAPNLTLNELRADGVLIGEIEVVALDFILHQSDVLNKNNFIYTKLDRQNLDILPIPAYELIDLNKYISYVPVGGKIVKKCTGLILANRGCPFGCEYCYTEYFGNIVRYRPTRLVIDEIRAMHSQGVNNFFFLDYTFTINKSWLFELLTVMENLTFPFTWGCETRIDMIDDEMLKNMSKHGCKYIWFGIESPEIERMGVNKKITQKQIEKIINLTKKYDIQAVAFILVGFDNEDIELLYEWCCQMTFIFDHSIIVPRPGTKLFNKININLESYISWNQLEKDILRNFSNASLTEAKYNKLKELPNYFNNVLNRS